MSQGIFVVFVAAAVLCSAQAPVGPGPAKPRVALSETEAREVAEAVRNLRQAADALQAQLEALQSDQTPEAVKAAMTLHLQQYLQSGKVRPTIAPARDSGQLPVGPGPVRPKPKLVAKPAPAPPAVKAQEK